jgi:hypothetical protein
MTSHELADMIYSVKEKLTDKEFKDIMDKLSIKNKKEDEPELYEFTYMKMREPTVEKFSRYTFGYNFCNYKIKTKDVVFDEDDEFKKRLLNNVWNGLHTLPFMLTKSENKKYYVLKEACQGMCANSIVDKFCVNPLADDSDEDEENECECDWGCDKCMYTKMKENKGVEIRYRKMIGLSIKKK